jgi:NADPH:quinone reductase-like Zn-dependent oxidoreductase
MRAISLPAFGASELFHFKEIQDPVPKEYEVKIRIKAAGFNPVDYKMRLGEFPTQLPVVLGADCSGVVESIGSKVKAFHPGDAVLALVFGQGSSGTYAESVSIDERFVAKKPSCLSFEAAAALPLAALTAFRCVKALKRKSKTTSLFIAGGGGGVGSLLIPIARALGGFEIFTTASGKESADYLTDILGVHKENILFYKGLSLQEQKEKALSLHQGRSFDAALDLVGKDSKELCLSLIGFRGDFVTIVPEEESYSSEIFVRGKSPGFASSLSLHFVFVGSESFAGVRQDFLVYEEDLSEILSLIESGKLKPLEPTVVGDFSLATVQKAHALLESGKVKGKLVMRLP